MKLRTNGDLEYYHNSRLRGSFSMLGSAVILDRKDPCRFEIDTGRGIWHLRTPWATDREVWVKNFQSIGAPSKSADAVIARLEARIDTLNKNIAVAKSLETVLNNRVEVIKSDPKTAAALEPTSEGGTVYLEESGEHHKKKKKGHSRQKSEALDSGSGSFLAQTQEVQRTVAQLIASIEEISTELTETVGRLDKAMKEVHDSNGSGSGAVPGSGRTGSSDDEMKEGHGSPHHEPMILYNEEHSSGSDSEDYFDADDMEMADADDSSSSMEYFDQSPPPATKVSRTSKSAKDSAIRDSNQSAGSASSVNAAAVPAHGEQSSAHQASSSGNVSGSTNNTPAKKKNSKSSKRRLSRSFNEEGRQASLKMKLKPSGVAIDDTLEQIPEDWAPRKALPHDKPKGASIPLMKILKDAVGKDISRITIPVSFSEPINMLQRMVEDFEYGEILLKGTLYFCSFSSFKHHIFCSNYSDKLFVCLYFTCFFLNVLPQMGLSCSKTASFC